MAGHLNLLSDVLPADAQAHGYRAHEGVSLSEYLRAELERVAASPTPDELLAQLQTRRPVRPTETSADALRAIRDAQA